MPKETIKEDNKQIEQYTAEDLFEPTAENAIRDMTMSKLLFLTKNGEVYSSTANEYIEKMLAYATYCKKEEANNWIKTIKSLIFHAGETNDEYILCELRSKEYAGIIMEQLANGKTMDEIKQIVREQGHSGFTISLLGQNMIMYSPYGLEFAEQVIGTYATKSQSELCKTYKREKRKQKKELL